MQDSQGVNARSAEAISQGQDYKYAERGGYANRYIYLPPIDLDLGASIWPYYYRDEE